MLDALLRNADGTESDDGDAEELEAVLGNEYSVTGGRGRPFRVGYVVLLRRSCREASQVLPCRPFSQGLLYRSYRQRSYAGRRLYSTWVTWVTRVGCDTIDPRQCSAGARCVPNVFGTVSTTVTAPATREDVKVWVVEWQAMSRGTRGTVSLLNFAGRFS